MTNNNRLISATLRSVPSISPDKDLVKGGALWNSVKEIVVSIRKNPRSN